VSTKRVLMVLAEGFEDIEAVAPIDILTRLGVEVTVAGLADGPVKAAYGSTILPNKSVSQVEGLYDGIVFPGGRKNAQALASDARVIELARNHYAAGKIVAAICAAPSHVLGEAAGLLKGKRATGDPAFNEKLAASGAIITNELVTEEGTLITGMGPGAAIAFGFRLAGAIAGKEASDALATRWGVVR
jgi:protein deglycase